MGSRGGIALGALLGTAVGYLVVYLRRVHRHAVGNENFLALGLIGLAYGEPDIEGERELATDPARAPAYMAHAVLSFNEQLDRFGELAAVLTIGLLLWAVQWPTVSWVLVALTLFAIRPVSVAIGLISTPLPHLQRTLIGWFGIRGVGSLYYLMYAINHGLPESLASILIDTTLAVIVASILLHGISVTPLMAFYRSRRGTRTPA